MSAVDIVQGVLAPLGAGAFGAVVGWYVYYVNRYRTGQVQLSDLTTVIGIVGGAGITTLFDPSKNGALFGAYGIGLAIGFFAYLAELRVLVTRSSNFDVDWFLDGRRKQPCDPYYIPGEVRPTATPMDQPGDEVFRAGDVGMAAAAATSAALAALRAAPHIQKEAASSARGTRIDEGQ